MMTVIKSLYIFFIALLAVHLSRSQEDDEPTLCEFPLNQNTWNSADLASFIIQFGQSAGEQISQVGYQDFMLRSVPGALADSYICGAEARCELAALNENCNDFPPVATILKAMANWSNFWQSMITAISETADFIGSQSSAIQGIFNPEPRPLPPANPNPVNAARVGLIIAQFFIAILAIYPPVAAIKDGTSVAKELVGVSQGLLGTGARVATDPVLTARFDEFGDLVASAGALRNTATEGIRQFIRDQLNDKNVFQNTGKNIITQIEGGEFAAPVGDLPQQLRDQLLAIIATPAINRVWIAARVVVVKFNRGTFQNPNSGDPCGGTNAIFDGQKLCDADGNAIVLRRIPELAPLRQLQGVEDLTIGANFDVPGLGNLGEFGLDRDFVMRSAIDNQGRTGYFGAKQQDDDFVQRLTSLDIFNVDLKDMVFANIAFCDFTTLTIPEHGAFVCSGFFETLPEQEMCEFNSFLLCACPGVVIKDAPWPYDTAQSDQCTFI